MTSTAKPAKKDKSQSESRPCHTSANCNRMILRDSILLTGHISVGGGGWQKYACNFNSEPASAAESLVTKGQTDSFTFIIGF